LGKPFGKAIGGRGEGVGGVGRNGRVFFFNRGTAERRGKRDRRAPCRQVSPPEDDLRKTKSERQRYGQEAR